MIVPYYITCIVIVFGGTIRGLINGDAVSEFKMWIYASLYGAGDTYTSPFYIPQIGAIWFLWATFWASIMLKLSMSFNKYFRMFFVLLLFALGYYTHKFFWFPLSIQAGACATLFMYMGYLLKQFRPYLIEFPRETLEFGGIVALLTWLQFIKNFQAFWLVNCNFGRGIIDILGCVCACIIVLIFSKYIEKKLKIAAFLAYIGKYSLLLLSIHVVELNIFPWWQLADKMIECGMPCGFRLYFVIAGKMLVDLTILFLITQSNLIKKIYGYKI